MKGWYEKSCQRIGSPANFAFTIVDVSIGSFYKNKKNQGASLFAAPQS
ncbi:hypothetical protein PPEP_a0639 [Pseudoalteromonas peptidolytica F12-50-A1]|uniref:Uncharacterized protein n=1 Tax=Pseudoalteromonas peptidolytica F12-50-A1 TaxID=1315280 RepID=A0A8I0MV21_9GAMM|nr:hypothetical protein [Pseudoalteromonas peptidolytica F12-50-A1]